MSASLKVAFTKQCEARHAFQEFRRRCFCTLLPTSDCYGHVVITQDLRKLDLSNAGASVERYQRASYYLLHRAFERPEASPDEEKIVTSPSRARRTVYPHAHDLVARGSKSPAHFCCF